MISALLILCSTPSACQCCSVSGIYLLFLSPSTLFISLSHSSVYHHLRPSRAPGFAYAWLELISHRIFIAKLLLQTPQQKVKFKFIIFLSSSSTTMQGWPLFHQLLIDLFKFLSPFLRNAELSKPTQLLYKVPFDRMSVM